MGHRLDSLSLLFGIVFVLAGVAQLVGLDIADGWTTILRAWPVLLVGAGLALVFKLRRPASDE